MSGLTRREIEAVKEDILSAFHCALPGIVEVFRPETRTADIRPAVRGRHKEELPLLQDVPVFVTGESESVTAAVVVDQLIPVIGFPFRFCDVFQH